MQNFLKAVAIGVAAGLIDVIPMVIAKLDKRASISAFLHYFVLGILIPYVSWSIAPWLKGSVIALATAIPIMIIVFPEDKKAMLPMALFSILLGAAIGIAGAKFIV